MLRPPLQVFTRPPLRLIPSRRNLHSKPTLSTVASSSSVSSPPPNHYLAPADVNTIHVDMFFERALVPRTPSQPSTRAYFSRDTTMAPAMIPNEPPPIDDHTILPPGSTAHFFDTHMQMGHLESCGKFSRQQARVVMETLQRLLRMSLCERKDTLLTRSQLENETYLINAALAEFRREVQLLRLADSVLMQSELTALAREVESLEQRLKEDLETKRSEIELSMNHYRTDVREEHKLTEHLIQGINNRFTVSLGDAATELESLKWSIIWRGLLGGVTATLGISAIGYMLSILRARAAACGLTERKAPESDLSYADMEIF